MQKLKLLGGAVLAVAAVALLVYQIGPSSANRVPTFDWQCAKCQYQFRLPVRTAAADLPVMECPKCKALAAERIIHFQCRNCWKKYDLRGANATRGHIICPACGSGSARDLHNPIPGDDTPAEGGKPYPGK
jgi:predicted nucleic acid-binding Zn ribbon protein